MCGGWEGLRGGTVALVRQKSTVSLFILGEDKPPFPAGVKICSLMGAGPGRTGLSSTSPRTAVRTARPQARCPPSAGLRSSALHAPRHMSLSRAGDGHGRSWHSTRSSSSFSPSPFRPARHSGNGRVYVFILSALSYLPDSDGVSGQPFARRCARPAASSRPWVRSASLGVPGPARPARLCSCPSRCRHRSHRHVSADGTPAAAS